MRPVEIIHDGCIDVFEKSYFRINGELKIEDPGAGGGSPEDYGLRFRFYYNGQYDNIYVYPCEQWDTWYDFTIEFSENYENEYLFFDPGTTHIMVFAEYPPGYDRNLLMDDVFFEIEYVPDMGNKVISVESFNTAGDEWHPKISWSGLNNFPTGWISDFHVDIYRKMEPVVGPIVDWEVIYDVSPNENEFIDYDLTSPADFGSGEFGIDGKAYYKVILVQNYSNPNYDFCDDIEDEWRNAFLYSLEDCILYGTNGSIGISPKRGMDDFVITKIITNNSTISFNIIDNQLANTAIDLYNLKGQHIKTICHDKLAKGQHSVSWNGLDKNNKKISSGIYLFKFTRGNLNLFRKTVFLTN